MSPSCGQVNKNQKNANSNSSKIEVAITDLQKDNSDSDKYILVFTGKNDSSKQIKMQIGKTEAEYIAIELEKMKPTAPLPLDVLEDAIKKFGYRVTEVFIYKRERDIYVSEIICKNAEREVILNARTADAATIGLKFNVPIYMNGDFWSK